MVLSIYTLLAIHDSQFLTEDIFGKNADLQNSSNCKSTNQ